MLHRLLVEMHDISQEFVKIVDYDRGPVR
jgi:hypothetical protein